jgi:ketol-acid reductoisomerase
VDLIYEGGLEKMHKFISNTAEYGEYISGPMVIERKETRERMRRVLERIQSGQFVSEWISEHRAGQVRLKTERKNASESLMEQVGSRLRKLMGFEKQAPLAICNPKEIQEIKTVEASREIKKQKRFAK